METLADLDVAFLLRVLKNNLSLIRRKGSRNLGGLDEDKIHNVINIRNRWAHIGSALPAKAAITSDISCIAEFYEQIGGEAAEKRKMQKYATFLEAYRSS